MSLNFKDLAPFRLFPENYIQIPVNLSLSWSEKEIFHSQRFFCLGAKGGKSGKRVKQNQNSRKLQLTRRTFWYFLKCHNCIYFTDNYTNPKLHFLMSESHGWSKEKLLIWNLLWSLDGISFQVATVRELVRWKMNRHLIRSSPFTIVTVPHRDRCR